MNILSILIAASALLAADPTTRTETFDRDPGWEGVNNRPAPSTLRTIEQNFGYDPAGRIGGLITPDGSPAYYAKPIPVASFNTPLSASGTITVEKGGGNLLLGFFNHDTINEWRTPNSMVFRINGRGDTFHTHIEYATSKWRAGAGIIGRYDPIADRNHPIEVPSEGTHTWSMTYDPAGENGNGLITVTFDSHTATCKLSDGHKADGATFNRFGLLNVVKSADGGGTVWIGDLKINAEPQDLTRDPAWQGLRNRTTYATEEVRPRFNFGYSPTHNAKGAAPGELGGLFFRGDCREPQRLACYGAKLAPLSLHAPIKASGKLSLHRAVSDSTTLLGFYHSRRSVEVNPSQSSALPMNFLGIAIEGPSSQGFYVYPLYRFPDAEYARIADGAQLIYPNGDSHTWSLEYRPPTQDAPASLQLTLDGTTVEIPVDPISDEAVFDRFGMVTPWIDGNGQRVYFDDLTFTCAQKSPTNEQR